MEPDLDVMRTDTLRTSLEQIRQAHPRTTSSATVYFVRCEDYLKIGTTRGPVARFSGIQTDNPFEIHCAYSFNCIDAYGCEGKIQGLFQQHQVRREWFFVTDEQLDIIQSVFDNNIDADPAAIEEDDKKFKIQQGSRAFSHLVNTFRYVSDESLADFLTQTANEKLEEGPERAAAVEVVVAIDSSKKRKRIQKQVKVKVPPPKQFTRITAPKVGGYFTRWQQAHAKFQQLTDVELLTAVQEDVFDRGAVELFKLFPARRAELTAEHARWYSKDRAALFHGYTLTLTTEEIRRLNLDNMAFAFRPPVPVTSESIETCLSCLKQLMDVLGILWEKFVVVDQDYRLDKDALIERTKDPLVPELCFKIFEIVWVHKDARRDGSGIALVRRAFSRFGRDIWVPDRKRQANLMQVSLDPTYTFLSEFIRPFITLKE
jgi:hypothetical protein